MTDTPTDQERPARLSETWVARPSNAVMLPDGRLTIEESSDCACCDQRYRWSGLNAERICRECWTHQDALRADRDAWKVRAERLHVALREYGAHTDINCMIGPDDFEYHCRCGLLKALVESPPPVPAERSVDMVAETHAVWCLACKCAHALGSCAPYYEQRQRADAAEAREQALRRACIEDCGGGAERQCSICLLTWPTGEAERHDSGCILAEPRPAPSGEASRDE